MANFFNLVETHPGEFSGFGGLNINHIFLGQHLLQQMALTSLFVVRNIIGADYMQKATLSQAVFAENYVFFYILYNLEIKKVRNQYCPAMILAQFKCLLKQNGEGLWNPINKPAPLSEKRGW